MITFFRRIRQALLSENKFSKYLLYAMGEIGLVVIGILIALQLNNYSEYNKERDQEILLLSNLTKEIQLDILQIENNTRLSEQRLDRLDKTIQSLANPDRIDKARFIEQSFDFVVDQYFKSNSGIFDEAVSSGKMSYILNEALRQNIFDYYRNAKETYNDATTRQVTDELITPLFIENLFVNLEGFSSLSIDLQNISNLQSIDLEGLKSNQDFWKMVALKFGMNREQALRWQGLKRLATQVKEEIEQELTHLD